MSEVQEGGGLPPVEIGVSIVPALYNAGLLGISVRNGTISGFASPLLLGMNQLLLRDLTLVSRLYKGGSAGSGAGKGSLLMNVVGYAVSFDVNCPSLVSNSVLKGLNFNGAGCTSANNAIGLNVQGSPAILP